MPSTRRLLPLALAAAGLALTAGPAAAAPSTDPQASAADAAHQLEVVTEQFNTARETSAQAAAAAAGATKADADAQAALTAARTQVRAVARSAYTGSRLTGAQALLTAGSTEDVITRLSTLQAVAD